jgi:formylglycine-generating enzyme required for sulfatase activity/tRNA A-37 threonylcarbamoyl transferase component Bud32
MYVAKALVSFGLRQAIGIAVDSVIDTVVTRYADPSQILPRAVGRAHDRSWKVLELALAGDGLIGRIRVLAASGEERAVHTHLTRFISVAAAGIGAAPAELRTACMGELRQLQSANGHTWPEPKELAAATARAQRLADPNGLVDAAQHTVEQVAADLGPDYPNLGQLLRQRPSSGPPLLVGAFLFFLRREVEKNPELARGLEFDGLRRLADHQAAAFADIGEVLDQVGGHLDELLESACRLEGITTETHLAVLDVHSELARVGQAQEEHADEVRALLRDAVNRLSRLQMEAGVVRPEHSFSIRTEDERHAVRHLLDRFRQLPGEERIRLPALLNGLGKLQLGAGDFAGAGRTFGEVVALVKAPNARAEIHYNAYRAALEARDYDKALAELKQAVALDGDRFEPFPQRRYEAKRILGAGGFGTAFLCHDRFFQSEVVVKALHTDSVDRGIDEVFREARVLRLLRHPSLISVLECNYADLDGMGRPYIVMEYFPGAGLGTHLRDGRTLPIADVLPIAHQVAAGMVEAHRHDILHRDLKPDNVLVRQEGGAWAVKVIDFGLALRREQVAVSLLTADTFSALGGSVVGTLKYAPPEQRGDLLNVAPCPASDVYAFGKLCCHALFGTTEPRSRQLKTVPDELRELLERCIEHRPEDRYPSFEPVLEVLDRLGAPAPAAPAPAPAIRRTAGEIITNSAGMRFAWVPPGEFVMGSQPGEPGRSVDESLSKVTVRRGFFLGVYPVTQAEWLAVTGHNPSRRHGADHPVEMVSWDDANAFCRRLSERGTGTYRLPTEAEWEYACRADTTTAYHSGNDAGALSRTGWCSADGRWGNAGGTQPVGQLAANAWGLFDTHGNVWEWCADAVGPAAANLRVLRGGSWFDPPARCRSAARLSYDRAAATGAFGLRVVLEG